MFSMQGSSGHQRFDNMKRYCSAATQCSANLTAKAKLPNNNPLSQKQLIALFANRSFRKQLCITQTSIVPFVVVTATTTKTIIGP